MKKIIILLLCISFFMPTVDAYAEIIVVKPNEEVSLGDEAEAIENANNKTNKIISYVGMGVTVLFLGIVLFQLTRYRLRLKSEEE